MVFVGVAFNCRQKIVVVKVWAGTHDAGNAIKRSDARDATVLATYDGVNRPLTETLVSAAGVVEQRIAYHYDSPSPRFPDDRFAAGALTWVEDGVGVEHYRHDDRDRLAEMIRVIDGKDFHLAEAHDDLDRLTRVTYPDGRTLDYRYNERGLLAQVPGIIDGVDYDERGFPTQRDYANGATSTAHYDALDRVDGLDTKVAGITVQSLTFGYDRVGNVRSIADAAHAAGSLSATRTLGYDASSRVERATQGAGPMIVDVADELDARLIVCGRRGRGPITSALLGSVSHAVLAHAGRPVLIAPER